MVEDRFITIGRLAERTGVAVSAIRINPLTRTRNPLDQCIGCGGLSLQKCQLYNKDDRMGAKGSGPRAILG